MTNPTSHKPGLSRSNRPVRYAGELIAEADEGIQIGNVYLAALEPGRRRWTRRPAC